MASLPSAREMASGLAQGFAEHALSKLVENALGNGSRKPTQDKRILSIYVDGFAENDFIATGASLTEKVSEPYEYSVQCSSYEHHALDATDLIGVRATVLIDRGNAGPRFFNGYITEIDNTGREAESKKTNYEIMIGPWLSLLEDTSDCRIFQEKTVLQVIEELFKPLGISQFDHKGVIGAHKSREYWVQYNESIVNFFHRLCQLEGIGYYFSHKPDSHTLHLFDTAERLPDLKTPNPLLIQPHTINHEHLDSWSMSKKLVVGRAQQSGYNYSTPRERLMPNATVEGQAKKTPMVNQLEQYRYSEVFDAMPDGQDETKRLNHQTTAHFGRWKGRGDYLHLQAGHHFTVERVPNTNPFEDRGQLFTLLSTRLVIDQQIHNCTVYLDAAPKGIVKTPVGNIPRITGLQTAFVTGDGNKGIPFTDPDGLGRIKVQFHWDREGQYDGNTTCWLRVMNSFCGPGFGMQHTPRIGQEVVVAFENGNPDKPFVLGSLPHGEHAPPFASDQGYRSGLRTRTIDPSDTKEALDGFNEVSALDRKGQEQLYLRAQKDLVEEVLNNKVIDVKSNEAHQVGKDLAITAGNSITLAVGGNTIQISGSGISINGQKVHVN